MRDPRRDLAGTWLRLDDLYKRFLTRAKINITDNLKELKAVNEALVLNSPLHAITMLSQELVFRKRSLVQAFTGSLDKKKSDIRSMREKLDSLSPLSVLERGYSITRKIPQMDVVKDSVQVTRGDEVRVLLAKGTIDCLVEKTEQGE